MSKDIDFNDLRFKIEPNELGRPKRIILHLRSGMTMLSFSGDSLILEDSTHLFVRKDLE
jgi:hypothetical protein